MDILPHSTSTISGTEPLWQWVIASLGYIGIVYVMFSGARRLELRLVERLIFRWHTNNCQSIIYIKYLPHSCGRYFVYSLENQRLMRHRD